MSSGHKSVVTIAVEGCCHGALDNIYESVKQTEKTSGHKVDLLVCCGDFQACRDLADLTCMACPDKYKSMNTYYKYYSGEKVAPVLTIFVGGNHEASNHLQELYYGGWVAPNMYYLGTCGVVRYGGLVIAGLSGIFKEGDYRKGQYERPPYNRSSMRSVYHTREVDVFKLAQIDILISHDWPRGIYHFGNKAQLVRKKPFFLDEIQTNTLGSRAGEYLLHSLQPSFWFAAHLHVKFAGLVQHPLEAGTAVCPPVRSTSGDRVDFAGTPVPHATKFLALDKCGIRRHFLQVLRMPSQTPPPATTDPTNEPKSPNFEYDPEWLAIVKKTHHLLVSDLHAPKLPAGTDFSATKEEVTRIRQRLINRYSSLTIPNNFVVTKKPYKPARPCQDHDMPLTKIFLRVFVGEFECELHRVTNSPFHPRDLRGVSVQQLRGNPQTDSFLELLGLQHRVTVPCDQLDQPATVSAKATMEDENEIDLDDLDDDDMDQCTLASNLVAKAFASGIAKDDNEIDLDDDDSDSNAKQVATNAPVSGILNSCTPGFEDDNEIDLGDDDSGNDAEPVTAKGPASSILKSYTSGVEDDNEIELDDGDGGADAKQVAAQPLAADVPRRKRIKLPPPVNSI